MTDNSPQSHAVVCRGVVKDFGAGETKVRALHGIDLNVRYGEMTLLVGPSGCGKTTLISVMAGLLDPTAGEVFLLGQDRRNLVGSQLVKFRADNIGFVFQQYNLIPSLTAAENAAVPLIIHGVKRSAAIDQARLMMKEVGLGDKCQAMPSQLSGGQQQRVAIARALVNEPRLLVCDEPISALDVSIQAQVMNLLLDLQEQFGTSMLFVSHDLRAVRQVSHRVAVMYLGRIVEEGEPDAVLHDPAHPYTRALVSAIPHPGRTGQRMVLQGDPPNPADRPSGCAFHPRCPVANSLCAREAPVLKPRADGRLIACHVAHGEVTAGHGFTGQEAA